jgi:outer membrane protein
MKHLLYATALIATLASFTPAAHAADGQDLLAKERFQLRLRAIDVVPDVSSSVNIGGEVDASNRVAPEIDVTYFLTDHLAAELIAATSKHDVDYTGNVALGDAWILPPTLTLQYHFTPDAKFSPYLGAGVNYSLFYNEKAKAPFTDLNIDGGFGVAAQAGFDYWVNDHWGMNLDVKKLWLNVDASLNNGAVKADVDLDPWIIGTGVSYRF